MATELLPVVDLRACSQSDLDALAAASAYALPPPSCPDADPLPPLKIDRAVFNESAGSRKQTFSRLRLGTAASSSSSPSARPTSAQPSSTARYDPDSDIVADYLRCLFVLDYPSLPPPPESQTLDLTEPRSSPSPPPDPDRETTNSKGISVDLVRLAGMVDPYDAELQRRTAGMASATELQGFIDSVAGQWVSPRQRRKYVDASFFGDHLPRGWKLQLGIKRKDRTAWVHCFSYVSPKGNQFSTCKEVSAYLMSLLGYPEVKSVTDNGADNVLGSKRRRTGKFGEPVVGKDGKFECPICQKTFEEESRYFGHVGSHARYQGLTPEAFFHKATFGGVTNGSLAEVAFTLQELTGSPGQSNKVSYGEAGFHQHSHSNEHGGNNSTVTELFNTNCSDNFLGPNRAQSRPEEIHPITDVPSVYRYPNATVHVDVTISKRASNTSNQSMNNTNGFAGVTVFDGQLGSKHVARPTAFGAANHFQDRIVHHGMTVPKHADNNTLKGRDVNLNSSLDTISFPIANANCETSAALNEVNRSSFTAGCFSGSFNSNDGVSSGSSCSASTNRISSSGGTVNKTSISSSRCFDPNYGPYGHNYGALEANLFANKNNTMVYQANLGTQPFYPVASKADCLASCPVQSNTSKEPMASTREHMDSVKNITNKEAGFGTEACNNGTFSGGMTGRGFAQFNNSFTHINPNSPSRYSLPESNTLAAGNFIKGSGGDINCMKGSLANRGDANLTKGSFVNGPIHNNEPNVPSRTSRNANGLMPTQANFVNMPSAVHPVGDIPVTSTTQDQVNLTGYLGSLNSFVL
ncbi:hypothetical protein HU200_013169 [Digitaria exilis]|uniref:Uncharacterized protein n=1 Tax=Digitaria exilis TaxID=1010633 RepID=A0A835KP25_9POAL|nr:hypothetical protein HU200_013169 [Digitaria exilis]